MTQGTGLLGRRSECEVLDQVLADVRAHQSQVLVLRGEAGVGKTALMDYLARTSSGCRVVRVAGVESEMELAFAGVHQLCAPMLARVGDLPGPQRDALCTAFGLTVGEPADRFLVGLAVLSLLSAVAEERPLVCLVDDAQWLDEVSAQVLGFVARRLLAESVALVFAVRDPSDLRVFDGLPERTVGGLIDGDARALLGSVSVGRLDARVQDRIIAETRGNPLALLELPRGLTGGELAGGFALPGTAPLSGQIEQSFVRRVDALPEQTKLLLLIAAAEPVGDGSLLRRAADRMGIASDAGVPAEDDGLIEIGAHVRFRHPLVRSAAYRRGSAADRRSVHYALAEVTDRDVDPDRRAWHLAHASAGPDDTVAADLERSAERARKPRRRRRRRRVLGAGGEVDRRPRPSFGASCSRQHEPSSRRPPSMRRTRWWRRRRQARSTSYSRLSWRSCAPSWCTRAGEATMPLRSCSTRPSASKGSMIALPARRISKRSARRSSPGGWARTRTSVRSPNQPAAHLTHLLLRVPSICCWTASRCDSRTDTARPHR